jgi:hypothetical protein
MTNTVLGFWDLLWIWMIVIIAGGGSTYLSARDTAKLDALEKKIAALTEALREKDAAPGPVPSAPTPSWLKRDEQHS